MTAIPNSSQNMNMNTVPAGSQVPQDALALDKQRVSLLLEINQVLLQDVIRLQEEGKGGDPQSLSQTTAEGEQRPRLPANKEYAEPLRRMQLNLAYLASLAERHTRPSNHQPPQWPGVMIAPPNHPKLAEMYARLQQLFPQWRHHQARVQQQAMAGQQGMGGPNVQSSNNSATGASEMG